MAQIRDDKKIETQVAVAGGERVVQVEALSLPKGHQSRNIFRIKKNGDVVWQVELLKNRDDSGYFTNIEIDSSGAEDVLVGYRVTGVDVRIDLETGKVLSEEFVK